MKDFLTSLFILIAIDLCAQDFYTDLYGFRLGQYREVARGEFGKPYESEKFDDGFEYDLFLLKPDKSLYMIFEYAVDDTGIIWSIQITGSDAAADLGFRGLKLGMDKAQLEKVLGKPNSIKDMGKYGDKWEYANTNFSIEVDKGKLSSIKITNSSRELFPQGFDLTKIPSFETVRNTLTSGNNAAILKMLSGNLEVYYSDSVYYFKKSFRTEQTTDHSKLLALIKAFSNDLTTVNTKNPDEYGENMRVSPGADTKHVIKLRGHAIREIVFTFLGGQYFIYEIEANLVK